MNQLTYMVNKQYKKFRLDEVRNLLIIVEL